MPPLLDVDQAIEILEGAFQPLMCQVSVSERGRSACLLVFDQAGGPPVVVMPARPLVELCEREFLRFAIDHVRSHLAGWGFELNPFEAPVKRL